MNTHYDGLLSVIRADIAAVEPKVAKLKRMLDPLVSNLARLRDMEQYLEEKCAAAKAVVIPASSTFVATPVATSQPQATESASRHVADSGRTAEIGPHEIFAAAIAAARAAGPGKWVRANDIAKRIIPNYDADADGRAFENRIFSLISRKEEFTRIGRGKFTLTEFLQNNPEMYPGWMGLSTPIATG